MDGLQETFVGLGVALGIGFLIGVDRERNKGTGDSGEPAFAMRVIPGVLLMLLAAGAAAFVSGGIAPG